MVFGRQVNRNRTEIGQEPSPAAAATGSSAEHNTQATPIAHSVPPAALGLAHTLTACRLLCHTDSFPCECRPIASTPQPVQPPALCAAHRAVLARGVHTGGPRRGCLVQAERLGPPLHAFGGNAPAAPAYGRACLYIRQPRPAVMQLPPLQHAVHGTFPPTRAGVHRGAVVCGAPVGRAAGVSRVGGLGSPCLCRFGVHNITTP